MLHAEPIPTAHSYIWHSPWVEGPPDILKKEDENEVLEEGRDQKERYVTGIPSLSRGVRVLQSFKSALKGLEQLFKKVPKSAKAVFHTSPQL